MFALRSLCRTCGIQLENESSSVKLFEKSNYHFIRLIEDITDMFLEFDNSMPDHVCQECKEDLDRMLAFRSKFLKVHRSFLVTKKKHLQWKEKSNKIGAECLEDESELMKGSAPSEEDMLQIVDKETDDMEDHLNQDKQDQENDDEENEQGQKYLDEDQQNTGAKREDFLEEDEARNRDELTASSKNAKKITARKAKQAMRNAKTWVCDQCGGVFKCSTYLKLHLLRHTGQKSFECDVCQAKYYTENEMRRHRILHTDARPYACRFCDKTFRGCSSKVIHERTHTNERPFQCQYCEMAFTSTSTRQRHELLHTNNRKYHCETCQHWFLRATHLALHQNTKLHKKRVASARKRCG